jgi:hypothetical protein
LKKKGVEQKQKQKQKQNQKQSGPLFFGLDVFFGVAISFFRSKLAFSFLSSWPMAADPDWSQRMLCPSPDWW